MREAIGGSILFYIILGFLAVYIIFIGIIMNYAATYRASNYIITQIEQTEGRVTQDLDYLCSSLDNYNGKIEISCNELNRDETYGSEGTHDAVYTIKTNFEVEIPLLGIPGRIDVKNQSKAIYGMGCEYIENGATVVKNCGGGR